MSVHQCPKCELRFAYKTELDDHCRHDHPQFRHEYPARPVPHPAPEPHAPMHADPEHHGARNLVEWVVPSARKQAH